MIVTDCDWHILEDCVDSLEQQWYNVFVAAGATEGGIEFVTEVCEYSDHVTGQRVRVSRHSYNHHIKGDSLI